jgi:hypothetical protein
MPKIGTNTHSRYYKMLTPLSVERLQQFIKMVSDGTATKHTEQTVGRDISGAADAASDPP